MWFVWLLLGLLVGFFAGVMFAAMASVNSDKQAISDGVIKLCGKLFVLKELDL